MHLVGIMSVWHYVCIMYVVYEIVIEKKNECVYNSKLS